MRNIIKTMFAMTSLDGSQSLQLPNPDMDSASNIIATLVDAGRNAEAQVIANKLGRDQEKTQLKWRHLPKDEWEALLRFWDQNFFFNFIYYSRVQGTKISRIFYIGDRSDKPHNIDSDGVPTAYEDCNANVVDTGRGL